MFLGCVNIRLLRKSTNNLKGEISMSKKLDPIVKRNNQIIRLREKGMTLKEIGNTVGLTGPRVYKVLNARREHTFYGAARMSFKQAEA